MRTLSDHQPTAPLIERFQGGLRANADARTLAERLLRGSELALEAARRDAAEAELVGEELSERILALEAELASARQEPEHLHSLLAGERRARRLAEQEAYAERARREELQQELAAAERELEHDQTDPQPADGLGDDERRSELEAEVAALRRRTDELGHLIRSARSARERAERRVAELTAQRAGEADDMPERASGGDHEPARSNGTGPGLGPSISAGLAKEFALAAQPVTSGLPAVAGPAPAADHGLALERELIRARAADANAQPEIEARRRAETRAAELDRQLSEQIRRSSRAYDAIEELRMRLGAIGGWETEALPLEPTGAEPPPPPVSGAPEPSVAPEPPAVDAEPEPPAVTVEPERFNAALTRLREAAAAEPAGPPELAPPPAPEAAPAEPAPGPAAAWLPRVFRRLVREDPSAAGQLVLELLPAQRIVHPEPIAYDLEFPGQICVRLTVTADGQRLELGARRPPGEVSFAVAGDPASLARLLAAGRLGRRLRRGLPTVSGDRGGLRALDALVRAPLSLRQLHDAGVRLEPALAFAVVARMIDPSWTRGSRFAIGYRAPGGDPAVYLEVSDGEPPRVSDAVAPARVAGTITCEPGSLVALLDGPVPNAGEFEGARARLVTLMSWVKRAQSG